MGFPARGALVEDARTPACTSPFDDAAGKPDRHERVEVGTGTVAVKPDFAPGLGSVESPCRATEESKQ